MKIFHSKSSSANSSNEGNNGSEKKKKFRRSSSVFFDPTTQVHRTFPDLIWKMAFHRLPLAETLNNTTLPNDQLMDLLHCTLLSQAVYLKKRKRDLPPNLSRIVYESKESEYYRIPYFIVNSEELDTIFIVFRGSKCYKDWHVDFLASAIEFEHGHVHEGVYFTSINIFNDIKNKVQEMSTNNNGRKIMTTGHSLGGAVASMISILFKKEFPNLNVQAVCLAPVASLSPEIWEMTHDHIRTYVNKGDLVPFISYYNTYYLPEDSLPKLPYEQLNNWCVRKINTHSKRPEFRELVENYTEPVTKPYKLVPPGEACLIRVVDKKKAKIELQKIEDSMEYFGQFVKDLGATKHTIKIYKNSIIRYFCQCVQQDEELIEYYRLARRRTKRKHGIKRKTEKKGNKRDEDDDNYNNDDDESNYIDDDNYNYNDDDDNYNYNDDNDNYNYNDDDDNYNYNDDNDNYNYNDDNDNYNYNDDDDESGSEGNRNRSSDDDESESESEESNSEDDDVADKNCDGNEKNKMNDEDDE